MRAWWLILLPLTALWAWVPALPPWGVMLGISLSLLAILKSVALLEYRKTSIRPLMWSEVLCWYLCWPGLNAREFLETPPLQEFSGLMLWELLMATAKSLLGIVCLVSFVPRLAQIHELLAGWGAMFGLLMLFHFGVFHILALVWRQVGRVVRPLMFQPVLARSVNDFWSQRWNLAFRDFANLFVLRPLTRRWNSRIGLWGVFGFSGLVHELAISVPARGGYGLPTLYFIVQGLGVTIERSSWGRKYLLAGSWRNWLFAFFVIGPPSWCLFHPPFLRQVILPLVGHSKVMP